MRLRVGIVKREPLAIVDAAYNPRPMRLVPGTVAGSYEIVTPIGAGGMGEVYRARDTQLHRDVAIEVAGELTDDHHAISAIVRGQPALLRR